MACMSVNSSVASSIVSWRLRNRPTRQLYRWFRVPASGVPTWAGAVFDGGAYTDSSVPNSRGLFKHRPARPPVNEEL
jgi:hypothetical protein